LGIVTSLTQRLGTPADAKLLIINCDDLGMSHAVNSGVYDALRRGYATSASLMPPCPWAADAAIRYRGEDIGVHLTLNSEWDRYRWGPITRASSLVNRDGTFLSDADATWRYADIDDVAAECRAQIECALAWGLDISHLDSHIHVLQHVGSFFELYLDLAIEFRLPIRFSGTDPSAGSQLRELASQAGVVSPDYIVHLHEMGTKKIIEQALQDLRPGVTEIYSHPAVDAPELRGFAQDWPDRVSDHDLLTNSKLIANLIERAGATLLGYHPLRELMRE
jgi:chitin disaccharide deacetylase